MKLIGTCMAGNEADLVEAFVRHNLGFLDALVVLDHASVDGTTEILAALAAEGLPLVLLRDPDRAYRQDERQTYLARRFVAELQADFAFVLDVDELIACPSRAALERALAELPPGTAGLVPLRNYFWLDEHAPADPPRSITRRLREERRVVRKVVVPRAFGDDPASHVSFGNHAAVRVVEGVPRPWPHAPLRDVALAHFAIRSPDQAARKAVLGWLAQQLSHPEKRFGARAAGAEAPAGHWRDMFLKIARGEVGADRRLLELANAHYGSGPVHAVDLVEDPLPVSYALRYTRDALPALASVASWAHQLIVESNAAGR